uniref:Lipoprotein n=1 Tax=Candidatus Kentrum sp. UNK TaxID=2126344 RepID=A0A451B1X4_9GAMM|nr:MAG: hypothetical protein BECKUNK1418G_GA0071005_111012 [Candidatus Kentron sp. UNK]VFK72285.1 MAG: hypothetical protein BECKUNK1418H_GA0071006_110512 [Candidatus Kentron sp. UNK]
MNILKVTSALVLFISLTGCGLSYFNPRPPVIEDRLGMRGEEVIGTLSTAPDYRVVYVRLDKEAKVCAEAPADAGAQFGSTFAAALTTPTGGATPLSAEARVGLAVAMKQLFKRSQGVQLYRDGAFSLCNLYLNESIDSSEYLEELRNLRKAAVTLIEKEIPYLEKITIDPITVPITPTPPQ